MTSEKDKMGRHGAAQHALLYQRCPAQKPQADTRELLASTSVFQALLARIGEAGMMAAVRARG